MFYCQKKRWTFYIFSSLHVQLSHVLTTSHSPTPPSHQPWPPWLKPLHRRLQPLITAIAMVASFIFICYDRSLSLSLVFSLSVKPPWSVGVLGSVFLSSSDPTFRVVGFWVFFFNLDFGWLLGGFGWICAVLVGFVDWYWLFCACIWWWLMVADLFFTYLRSLSFVSATRF